MKSILVGVVTALALAGPAQADFTSAYTDLNLDECLVLEADDFGVAWSCPGYKGYPLKVMEGDLRFYLQFGFNQSEQRHVFADAAAIQHAWR